MTNYQRRQGEGKSSRLVHVSLRDAISSGERIEIHTRPVEKAERAEWRGLPVSVILGAEAALIEDLHPIWNRRGRLLLLDRAAVNEDDPEA
jgi:hypothetical protein